MKKVRVLSESGNVLNPCHPARARILVNRGRAFVVSADPMTIRLIDKKKEKEKEMAHFVYDEGQSLINLDQVCRIELKLEEKESKIMFFFTTMTARDNWHYTDKNKAKEVYEKLVKMTGAQV